MLDMLKEIQDGNFTDTPNVSLSGWIRNWLDNYIKLKVRQTTWESYDSIYRTHIADSIGHVKLCKLKTSSLQSFYNELLQKKIQPKSDKETIKTLSPRTVRYVNQVIAGALKQAIKENLIKNNPTEHCILPKDKKQEMKTLTVKQMKLFLNVAKDHRLYASFLLDLTTGLRRGELLALSWSDVDFFANTIKIEKQLVITRTGNKFTDLKTSLSRRTIDVPLHVMNQLKAHKIRQQKERRRVSYLNKHKKIIELSY